MSVNLKLAHLALALTFGLAAGAVVGGVDYAVNDVGRYQEKYPSLSSSDAQSLRESDARKMALIASCLTMISLSQLIKEHHTSDKSPKIS